MCLESSNTHNVCMYRHTFNWAHSCGTWDLMRQTLLLVVHNACAVKRWHICWHQYMFDGHRCVCCACLISLGLISTTRWHYFYRCPHFPMPDIPLICTSSQSLPLAGLLISSLKYIKLPRRPTAWRSMGSLQAEEQNQCGHSMKGIIDVICLY